MNEETESIIDDSEISESEEISWQILERTIADQQKQEVTGTRKKVPKAGKPETTET